jgi:hypothetical protein
VVLTAHAHGARGGARAGPPSQPAQEGERGEGASAGPQRRRPTTRRGRGEGEAGHGGGGGGADRLAGPREEAGPREKGFFLSIFLFPSTKCILYGN